MRFQLCLVPALLLAGGALALPLYASEPVLLDRFRPLDELLPQPDGQRTGGGEPGPDYWQQQADYVIRASLDEAARAVDGSMELTYWNRSPHTLEFLWLHLDANALAADSLARRSVEAPPLYSLDPEGYAEMLQPTDLGSIRLLEVAAADGTPLRHRVLDTLARVDLAAPLPPGGVAKLRLRWRRFIPPAGIDGRGGWEELEDGELLFAVGQWYPRVAAYTALDGWNLMPFLGQGEFTQEFGEFRVEIDVPAGMVVAATGELSNSAEVLDPLQRSRLEEARHAASPVAIITGQEARLAQRRPGRALWRFEAYGVRDFAWAASRRFAWHALAVPVGGRSVLAMSFHPPEEAGADWPELSTRALAHAVRELSTWLLAYPWPVIVSVNGGGGGMEYPMLAFNAVRLGEGAAESEWRELVQLILHEAAHNWFPMLVNSDERRWSWMDEGLVTFLHERLEQSWWGEPAQTGASLRALSWVMRQPGQVPLMTSADSIEDHGSNAYTRAAAALWVLREAILGPARFDEALAAYVRRWAGKRPHPADFFRTVEQVSGEDLDWFFRSWFYTVDHVNLQLLSVTRVEPEPVSLGGARGVEVPRVPPLRETSPGPIPWLYLVEVRNTGGIPSPIVLGVTCADGNGQRYVFPAQIWRSGRRSVTVAVSVPGVATRFELDPEGVTGDIELGDNVLLAPFAVQRFPWALEP